EVHRAPPGAGVVGGRVDEVLAVVRGDGEVLERDPAGLRLSQRPAGGPAVRRREVTLTRVAVVAAVVAAAVHPDELPLLVGAAPVVVLNEVGPARGRRALDLQGLAAVPRDEPYVAAVAVGQPPLLVGAVVVGPLDDRA